MGLIARGLLAEYAVLGALAGGIAAVAAQLLAWVLAANVFHIAYGPRPLLWLLGMALAAAIVCALGWLSLRSTLRTPPTTVLRQTCQPASTPPASSSYDGTAEKCCKPGNPPRCPNARAFARCVPLYR